MSRVVLDVSMSLDGFTAGPNIREAEPMGTAANASTPGWPATDPTARSMSPCAEHWTPVLAPRSSAGAPWISVSALGRHAVARCAQRCGHASGDAWTRSATTAGPLPSTGCRPRSSGPSRPPGTTMSWCWASMSPASCSPRLCSASSASTWFRCCWVREPHCSKGGAGRTDPSSQARDRDPPTLPSPVLRTALPGVASPANPAAFSYAHEFHGHRRSI